MSRAKPRTLLTLAGAVGLSLSGLVMPALAQPGTKSAEPRPAARPAPGGGSGGASQQDKTNFRDRMRERCLRLLAEMREDIPKLEAAIKKLDAGESFEEVRESLSDRLAMRFRGNDGGEGDGRRGEWFGQRADQPFTDQDWEAVNAIIKHAQPDMLAKFDELRAKDPAQAQKSMLEAYPRLRPLLDLYKFDRTAFDLRLEELVILRQSLPLAKEVLTLKKAGKDDDSAEVKASREKLRELGKRQHENRLAIQRHELKMWRQRLEKRQKDLDEQTEDTDKAIERAIDGLVRQAERGDFGGSPPPEHRGDAGRRGERPDGRDPRDSKEPREPRRHPDDTN